MCIVVVAKNVFKDWPLVLLGNRDEFYLRESTSAQQWQGVDVYGGRDLKEGGSWMGVTPHGRWAVVTNVRVGVEAQEEKQSRGKLIEQVLTSSAPLQAVYDELKAQSAMFRRFNLLFGDAEAVFYLSNEAFTASGEVTQQGIFGVSNGGFDEPWPKLKRLKASVGKIAANETLDEIWRQGLHALSDDYKATDEVLPETGVSVELERFLSSIFISGEEYGTRASSLIAINKKQSVLCEQTYLEGGEMGEFSKIVLQR